MIVSLGFIIGCATGAAVSEFVAPPAHGAGPVNRWEYFCIERSIEKIARDANKLGAEGWEMTAAAGAGWGQGFGASSQMIWCFKRQP